MDDLLELDGGSDATKWQKRHAKKGIAGRYTTAPDPALVAAADKISLALAMALHGTTADNVAKMQATVS